MARQKKTSEIEKKALDTFSQKPGRGRPFKIRSTDVAGRAKNFRGILDQVWERLWPLLSNADTTERVIEAFEKGANPYERNFVPHLAELTLRVLNEPVFPRRRKSQIKFLADSLAGVGVVTPRRSRDICAAERAKAERQHHIIRYEFYVECSCGYKGPSKDHACLICGAKIPPVLQLSSFM